MTEAPVIVTGAGGFVGRALVTMLLGQGQSVTAVDTTLAPQPGMTDIVGDLADPDVRRAALAGGCGALVHLATVPGGAAEADPERAWQVNVEAARQLLGEVAAVADRPRVVFASSIAVFGEAMPAAGVDDETPLSPHLHYGTHKAMVETLVAMQSNRGAIDGLSLRLPGIVARPPARSGLKSAFLSDLFTALRGHRSFVCPVSANGTVWLQSVRRCAANLGHALSIANGDLPASRACTLPALRATMGDLVTQIAQATGADPALVTYCPDTGLERAFAAQPPLTTRVADRLGFRHDGDLASLVASALATLPTDQGDLA